MNQQEPDILIETFAKFSGHFTLSEDEHKLLDINTSSIIYNKGETIIKQGSFITHILFIREGLVKLMIEGNNERNVIIKITSSGEFVGLSALYMQDVYPFSVVALKPSSCIVIKREAMLDLIKKNEKVGDYLMKWYSDDYNFLYRKLSIIGTRQMHGRLSEALLYLDNKRHSEKNLFHYLTRKDIAELASMSLESMTKIMTELKNDLIIKTEGKDIQINDKDMLTRLCKLG